MSYQFSDVLVMGAGHVGLAVSAFLSAKKVNVHLFSRRFLPIAKTMRIKAIGSVLCGDYSLASCSTQLKTIASEIGQLPTNIIICCRGNDITEYARLLSKYIYSDMNILLFCGSRLDDLTFRQELLSNGILQTKLPAICASTSSPFCCCLEKEDTIEIKAKKNKVSISAQNHNLTERVFAMFQPFFENLYIAHSSLEIALQKRNDIIHIPLMLTSARSLELGKSHLFYHDVDPTVISLIDALDEERKKIAQAYGLKIDSVKEWQEAEYRTDGVSTYQQIKNNCAYQKSVVDTLDDRYLTEDLPHGAIPLQALARLAGVKTPILDGCIALGSQLIDIPQPWTSEFLGITNLNIEQVSNLCNHSRVKEPLCLPAAHQLSVTNNNQYEYDNGTQNINNQNSY